MRSWPAVGRPGACCQPPSCVSFPDSAIKPAAGSPAPGEALPAGEWETVQLRGSWRTGQTAGGSRNFASYPSNPCFPLSVPEGPGPRCVRVTLHQHCQDSQCHPIGFHIFQASSSSCSGGGGEALRGSVSPWVARHDRGLDSIV